MTAIQKMVEWLDDMILDKVDPTALRHPFIAARDEARHLALEEAKEKPIGGLAMEMKVLELEQALTKARHELHVVLKEQRKPQADAGLMEEVSEWWNNRPGLTPDNYKEWADWSCWFLRIKSRYRPAPQGDIVADLREMQTDIHLKYGKNTEWKKIEEIIRKFSNEKGGV